MKITLLLLTILVIPPAFAKGPPKDATSWSLMYGMASLNDGKKKAEELEPYGNAFKGIWAQRNKYWEFGLMVRFTKQTDDFTFQNIKGDFSRKDSALGMQGGFWAFSWLKLNLGYALHSIVEEVDGDFTSQQEDDIEETYGLVNRITGGVYGGADLVLFQTERFQFFANYDYYYLNSLHSHDWEGMVGMRIYLAPSNVGKGNFFVQLFKNLIAPENK